MTEQQILDQHCKKIEEHINLYIDRNDLYGYEDMKKDIRKELQDAMRKARREALRGN